MNDLEDRISNITIDDATFSENGLFTSEEKTKLNGIQEGATKNSITRGTSEPSGDSDGDIYLRYSQEETWHVEVSQVTQGSHAM